MSNNDVELDPLVQLAIYRLMLALYEQGITEIHMGGLMRIMGLDNEMAQNFDDERVNIDDRFARHVHQLTSPRAPDQPLH
jgi:hypothetical protein